LAWPSIWYPPFDTYPCLSIRCVFNMDGRVNCITGLSPWIVLAMACVCLMWTNTSCTETIMISCKPCLHIVYSRK
jgi:hypothetical protein